MDKTAFRSLTYGMYLVSSLRDGKPVGCVANTFTQVTSSPAQASIALNKDNFTTQGVRETGRVRGCRTRSICLDGAYWGLRVPFKR